MNFCPSSGWQKTTPNPCLTIPTTATVPIITKMEFHQWYHSCHQNKRLAAAYPASSPQNDCSSVARRRAVPRPIYPSLYPKVVRLIRPSILLQPPSQRLITSPPPQWEALKLLHRHHKQTYPHPPLQTHTPTSLLSTNAPTEISNHRVAALEPCTHTPKTHKATHPQLLRSTPTETATAAILRLPQVASEIAVHLLSSTNRRNNNDNNSSSSNNYSRCKTSHPPLAAIIANQELKFSNPSASAWKTPAKRSFRRLSRNTTSTPIGRTMPCT